MSVLDATWIDEKDLKRAISSIKKFVPSVLVTTEDQFNGYAYAFNVHRMVGLKKSLLELGIKRIIWAEYMPDRNFELTSEASYQNLITNIYPEGVDVINLE